MNAISLEEYSAVVADVLRDDKALLTVLQALYEAKEGIYLDVTKKAPEGTISLGEIFSSDVSVSREFAQRALMLSDFFYGELKAYREDREAWLNEQAEGVGRGAMQSADALSASLLYLVNDCHKLWGKESGVRELGGKTAQEIHQLFAKTPMSDMLSSINSAPTLEQDEIRRMGCLLGMISYITLKTGHLAQESKERSFSGVPRDISFDMMILWACALVQSKCIPRQEKQYLQDVAVIALCMACSFSGAGDWAGQKAALHSLRMLTAGDGKLLWIMTDARIKERENRLAVYETNGRIRALIPELLKATSAEGRMQMGELAEEITEETERAWSSLNAKIELQTARTQAKRKQKLRVQDEQVREDEREEDERHTRKERSHEE